MPRILVIDDDELMRGMIRDLLEGAGYEIEEAGSSEEGVSKFCQQRPDLVITDLFIPSKGGIEIIKEIIAEEPEARIIAISGVELSGIGYRYDQDPKDMAIKAGALQTFKKPFVHQEFLEAISNLLND